MAAITEAQPESGRRFDFGVFLHRFGTLGIFIVLVVAASFWSPSFLTRSNVLNVLRQVATGSGVMAVGMLYVILTGGIDLSVGSIAALGSVLSAYFIAFSGFSVPVSVFLVILAGGACGLVTGGFVAYLKLPSFVMSLAMMAIARGLALIFSAGRPIPLPDSGEALADFGSGYLFGLPQPVILMFAIFIVGGIVLNFTSFGRIITAIGSNQEAVRLSGIAVPRYMLAVYVISGALAGLAGIVSTSRTGVGSAQVGVGAELDVIAAVVIGGASLMGGRGGVINTLLGALVMGIIANIMNLAGVPGYNQNVYMGLIIVLAMLIQYGAGSLKPEGMGSDLTLSIDIGTGSVRAALIDGTGAILHIAAREHDQIVPQFGWAEQRPLDWWTGVSASIREALGAVEGARERIAAVAACGQMHGVVLIDEAGRLTRDAAPLWNDKRTAAIVAEFERDHPASAYLAESGNPATPAWPGFKLMWLERNDPGAYRAARAALMPKDYINFRLTGAIAMDAGDASCSFLMNPRTRAWSERMIGLVGLDAGKLPPIREPLEILGAVTAQAASETGLREGTPVLVGGADYPMALLGSGACRPGLASDVTGTSCILTLIADAPLLDPEICNVATIEGHWGPFVLLETGGDAMRWARRAFHEKALGYDDMTARAASAPAGSEGLIFMPYLTGERLGAHRNARAQFFGLGAGHGLAHLHRAILEGVAFAAARHLRIMEKAAGLKVERVIASGGGARAKLWLKIKASVYGAPIVVPKEPECGIIGCAALAAAATGRFARLEDAVQAYVRHVDEVKPDPAWAAAYARMQPVFDRLYIHSQALYDDLDALAASR